MTSKETECLLDICASAMAYYCFCCAKINGTNKTDSDYEKSLKLWRDHFEKKMIEERGGAE